MKKRIILLSAAALVVIAGVILAIAIPKDKGGARSKPKTTYDGETVEVDPVVAEKTAKLDLINPTAYGRADGIAVKPGTQIAIIGKQSNTPFWDAVEEGAQDAAVDLNAALNLTGDDEISVTFDAPEHVESAEEQINILDETLGRNPQAIGIAMIDEKAYEMQLDQATENGIPVVALDSGNNSDTLVSKVATDNYQAARDLTGAVCTSIGESGTIDILVHDNSSETARERLSGIIAELEENHPDVKIGKIDYLTEMNEDEMKEKAEEMLKEEESSNPDLKAVIATNTASLSACEACWKEGSEIQLFGFDGGEKELLAVQNGELGGFVLQNPYGMGYASVIAAVRGLAGAPNESKVNTGYTLITPENCDSERVLSLLYE